MKQIITALLLSLSAFLISACKEDIIRGVTIDTNVDLVVKNAAGKNLLDPTTTGYYKLEDIHTYILQDGKKVEVNLSNLDAPRDFRVVRNEGNSEYYLDLLYQHTTVDQEKTTTYIQWRVDKVDTLQMLFAKPNSATTTVNKVWLNGKLKYDVTTAPVYVDWGNGRFRRLVDITH